MPDNKELSLQQDSEYPKVTVPKFGVHCAVVFEY